MFVVSLLKGYPFFLWYTCDLAKQDNLVLISSNWEKGWVEDGVPRSRSAAEAFDLCFGSQNELCDL